MFSRGVNGVRRASLVIALAALGLVNGGSDVHASTADIVLYASEAAVVRGNWAATASTDAAGGRSVASSDLGFTALTTPLSAPANYFEMTFDAPAATTYRVWLRLRATANSKWNDAVWVQFSDATLTTGASVYGIGTSTGLMVNLERCSGCGTAGWGWQNGAYWLTQATQLRFATTGTHTIRVQTREDGVEIDQIVLSPVNYSTAAPGALTNDATIVQKAASVVAPALTTTTPYGTVIALPGTINAANFDNGGPGAAYSDTTVGNSGNVYRTTDVDLAASSLGHYHITGTAAGEWVKYTVSVPTAGNYIVEMRAAAIAARTAELWIGDVKATYALKNTGGWQRYYDHPMQMTLAAGRQTVMVKFTTGEVNLRSIRVTAAATLPISGIVEPPRVDAPTVEPPTNTTPPEPIGAVTGGTFRMITWNLHHGYNTSGKYNLQQQMQYVVSHNPDVVALQEVATWDVDQPRLIKAMLEQLTGVPWYSQWAPVINNVAGVEGNMVLTRLPVVSSTYHQMHATGDYRVLYANRSAAQATVLVGGVPVHVFSTHLDYANKTYRTAQLLDMMAWTSKFGERRVVGGDFNSWWGEYWITTMMGDYYDTWYDVTKSKQNGHTVNNAVRFDYLFRSKIGADKVTPVSVQTPVTYLSDHNPVIGQYSVKP